MSLDSNTRHAEGRQEEELELTGIVSPNDPKLVLWPPGMDGVRTVESFAVEILVGLQ